MALTVGARRALLLLMGWCVACCSRGAPVVAAENPPDIRVGAAAVNLRCDQSMVLAGFLEGRFTSEQEGELRSVAVVVEKPGQGKVAIVACDVLWVPRDLADAAVREITEQTAIPADHLLINATHTHHAPSTAPAHAFGVSPEFRNVLRKAIVESVVAADRKLQSGDARFFFHLGEENTIGANSRLLLADGNITWLNPLREAGDAGKPTGPFDPQLPVLDFRDPQDKSRAIIYNHSTHTIGTRAGRDIRSPGFYGLAAQELETELGGVVSFLEGASGSTHNIAGVPVDEAVRRLKRAVLDARQKAQPRAVHRVAGMRRPLKFRVRHFGDAEEDAKILRYTSKYAGASSDRIREIFANMRRDLGAHQGEERETWIQAIVIGDVAIVGVPAEYFTVLGIDIKKRSPFANTYVAELANDWIGYLPDRQGHQLGGYQTWMGWHSYAEPGTGERVADLAVEMLRELAAQPDASPAATEPQSPAKEQESFRLADPGLSLQLVAAEPDVLSPVAMAWDAEGRLFVAEMIGYPATEGQCRIALLEDRDGDGHYQRRATFADQLSFVNSLLPFRDGLLAIAAPDLLFLEDTNDDGQADVRRVEWTGFGTGSQQLRANALTWGLDNWIYGANGRCDGDVRRPDAPPESAISIRARDFRLDLRSGAFEAILGQSQFGQARDDWGNRFLSWNTVPVRHVAIEDRYLAAAPGQIPDAVVDVREPEDTGRVYPISPPPRQFNSEPVTYYNAMCGLTIYRSGRLGPEYAGNAFICESLGNLVTRRVLEPAGPTFVSHRAQQEREREFLASTDGWFHPVNLATGPDGSLYVADFYRQFVEHPIYVADPAARANTDWRRGAEHGRIWRVCRADTQQKADKKPPSLSRSSTGELVALFEHPVGWWRDTAQRLLVERRDPAAAEPLRQLVRRSNAPLARLHALWTLKGLDALDDATLSAALGDSDPRLRRHAVRLAEDRLQEAAMRDAVLALVADSDANVRLQVALAIGRLDRPEAAEAMARFLGYGHDRWTVLAVLCSSVETTRALLQRLSEEQWFDRTTPDQARVLQQIARHLGDRFAPAEFRECLDWLVGAPLEARPVGRLAVLAGLVASTGAGPALGNPPALPPTTAALLDSAAPIARQNDLAPLFRIQAIDVIGSCDPRNGPTLLLELIEPQNPPAVQIAAARALANQGQPDACRQVYERWARLGVAGRQEAIASAARSRGAIEALLAAIENEIVLAAEVPHEVRFALVESRDTSIKDRAARLLAADSNTDRQTVVTRYDEAARLSGDARSGGALFKEHCLTCHAVHGHGGRVGPDLAGVGSRRRDLLIVDILDPSRNVTPDFINYVAGTVQGQSLAGIIVAETADSVTLRSAGGQQETLHRSRIEQLRSTGKSIMPDGFEEKLSVQQFADVLEFLRRPDRELIVAATDEKQPSLPAGPSRETNASSTPPSANKYPLDDALRILAEDVESPQYRKLVTEKMLVTDLAAEWQRVATADNPESFLEKHGGKEQVLADAELRAAYERRVGIRQKFLDLMREGFRRYHAVPPFDRGVQPEMAGTSLKPVAVPAPALQPIAPVPGSERNWPRFRGPTGQGMTAADRLPTRWNKEGLNILWRTPTSGSGNSSPIIWEDRIFATSSTPDGDERSLWCWDRATGRLLWTQVAPKHQPEQGVRDKNGFASATPVTDGQRIIAFLGSCGLVCYDFEGKLLWSYNDFEVKTMHGTGSSPILYRDLVILMQDQNQADSICLALDKVSGERRWQVQRPRAMTWCTPIAVRAGDRDELVFAGGKTVKGYDPATGNELWSLDGPTEEVIPTVLAGPDLLISASGRNGPMIALRPGGNGDVTATHLVWRTVRGGPHVPSPILIGNRIYVVNDTGIASCLDYATGKPLWQSRIRDTFSASPVEAAGLLYFPSESGMTYVLRAADRFEIVSENDLGSPILASPAVFGNQLFLRTQSELVCIGEP